MCLLGSQWIIGWIADISIDLDAAWVSACTIFIMIVSVIVTILHDSWSAVLHATSPCFSITCNSTTTLAICGHTDTALASRNLSAASATLALLNFFSL